MLIDIIVLNFSFIEHYFIQSNLRFMTNEKPLKMHESQGEELVERDDDAIEILDTDTPVPLLFHLSFPKKQLLMILLILMQT